MESDPEPILFFQRVSSVSYMKNKLYIVNGRFDQTEFPLEADVVFVGRGPDNNIRINDRSVSRSHLQIRREGDRYLLMDLGSRNGTRIEGTSLESHTEVPVRVGQHVSVGNIVLTIGHVFEEDGLVSRYMIDVAGQDEDTERFRFLKDRRITDREKLEIVHEVSGLLMQSLDLQELLGRIVTGVFTTLAPVDTMALLLVEEETGQLNELASQTSFEPGDPRGEYSLTVVHRTIDEGKAVILTDTELEDSEDIPESVALKQIKSVMCVPLLRKTRILGALYVHSVDKPFGYRKSDLYLLTALSGSAAVAIENALLFQKQQAAEEALKKAHAELEERVVQRTRQLSVANDRLKTEIEERKRTEAALKESEEHLRDLFDNAKDLIQSVSPDGRFLFVNRIWMETLGYSPEEVSALNVFDVVAPESLPHCKEALDRVISGENIKDLEAVFLAKDGKRIHVDGNINCKFEQGQPIATRAIFRDVTARKAAEEAREEIEERFQNLARAAQDAIISIDHQGRITYWNRSAETMFGYTAKQVVGKDAHELLVPERYRKECDEAMERWKQTGQGAMLGKTRELAGLRADGSEFPIELSLSSGRVKGKWNALAIVRDITERKQAEAALEKRTRELDMRYKQVYCLYAVSRLKGDPAAGLESVLQGVVDLIPDALQYPDIACARLTHEGKVFVSAGFQETSWGLKRTIQAGGRQTGHVEIFYTEERPGQEEGPFLVEERTLLRVIAEQAGEIIELKQAAEDLATAREREIEIGSKIQQTLLLGSPPRNVSGIRIAAMSVPSQRVDGDFYEFIPLSDRVMDLIVGDVMGKGVPAALLGAGTKGHFLKALSAMLSPTCRMPLPADIVQYVHNRMVLELIDLEAFVTLTYARFDLDRNVLEFVDCGHPRTLHVKAATNDVNVLEGRNVPLGFRLKETYQPDSVSFEEGDLFFFYSDGITETRDDQGRFFGQERLARVIRESAHFSVEQVIDRVRNAVMGFSATRSFSDDLTCVAVKIGDSEGRTPLLRMELELLSRYENLETLRDFVLQFCAEAGVEGPDEDVQWQIEIALNEAASNIVKHAYDERPEGLIHVTAEAFPDSWVFTLRHWGKPFQGIEGPAPPVDLTQDHGFGLIIMDNYMDRVLYSRSADGTNTVRLVKMRETAA